MLKNIGAVFGIALSALVIVCSGLFIYFSFYGCGQAIIDLTVTTTTVVSESTMLLLLPIVESGSSEVSLPPMSN